MMLAPVRTVAPATLPVSLAWAKEHLKVTSDDQDSLIASYIDAAVSHLDGWSGILGRCMVSQTWRQDYDGFYSRGLKLPFPDVQSVVVSYNDENGATQTLADSNYHLVNEVGGTRVILSDGGTFPGTADRPDAVRVTMVAGYGTADDVPPALQAAILLHVGHLFENRGDTALEADQTYTSLVRKHRRVGL